MIANTSPTVPRILIAEDEEGIRNSVARLLRLEGYEVTACSNGKEAWEAAQRQQPDVLITDIHMPAMDGFALLGAFRAHPELANCVIIMLTAAEDRANMRRGMTSGADDYITKPFKREELLESLAAQLKRKNDTLAKQNQTVADLLKHTEDKLRREFTAELANTGGHALADATPTWLAPSIAAPQGHGAVVALHEASVLFADIRNFTSAAERLSVTEVAQILAEYFERACEPIQRQGGHHLRILGDGLMAVFDDAHLQQTTPHARRALLAGLDLAVVAQEFHDWLQTWFGDRGLPPFAIGVGVHTGEVMFSHLGTGATQEVTPLGDAVNTASRLEGLSKELGWTLVVSQEALVLAGSGFEVGRTQLVPVRGRSAKVQVCELLGVNKRSDVDVTLDDLDGLAETNIRDAIQRNSALTARAVKQALQDSLAQIDAMAHSASHALITAGKPPTMRFKGYTLVRKIGQGGMSDVYLAHDDKRDQPVVLKLLRTQANSTTDTLNQSTPNPAHTGISNGSATAMLQRFIQEYAVLSHINHPHIARIFDQGFADGCAYLAMEYFSGGTLQVQIDAGMTDAQVVTVMRHISSALGALHAKGLVHRDLKPDNVMGRATGEWVLADFGVVKSLLHNPEEMVKTRHGEIVGTPYYFSPEQALGGTLAAQSDFYSLGVMLFEMLTQRRPYGADSLEVLIARHLYAAVPTLPSEKAHFQPLVNRLMAKSPKDRYQSVAELSAALPG